MVVVVAVVVTVRRFKRYCFTPRGKREKCEVELAGNSFVSIPNCRKTRSNVVLVFSFLLGFSSPPFFFFTARSFLSRIVPGARRRNFQG